MNFTNLKIPLAFLCVIAIWSTTPLAIQWSSGEAPLTSALIRMIIGILCCLTLLGLTQLKLPTDLQARRLYVVCGISIYVPMSLVYVAAQFIPSGWIAVVFGLSPLLTGVFSLFVEPEDRLTISRTLGLLLGLSGLYLVFSASLSFDEDSLKGILMVLGAVVVSAASSVVIRQIAKSMEIQGMQITTGGLLVAIPFFAVTAWLTQSATDINFSTTESLSILYLGMVGTGVGFTLYYYLLKKISASRVAMVALITPITALAVGSWLNNEPTIPSVWIGAALVCSGLMLYEFKPKFGIRKL